MRHFVFRQNFKGFEERKKSINSFRGIIRTYTCSLDSEYKRSAFEEYKEANARYKEYLEFRNHLTEHEKEWLKVIANHHVPEKDAHNVDWFKLYNFWIDICFIEGGCGVKEIRKQEIAYAIKSARESRCQSLQRVADTIGVPYHTYKSYDSGRRKLPFDVYYKLIQILKIEIF